MKIQEVKKMNINLTLIKNNKKWLLISAVIAMLLISIAQPVFAAAPYTPSDYSGWTSVQMTDTAPTLSNYPAVLSSNDSKIAYSLKNGDDGGSQFFVLDTTTKATTELTSLAAGDFDPYTPTITADGSKVAFQSSDGQIGSVIVLINSDGTNKTVLTDRSQYVATHPSISGDGSKIAFQATIGLRNEIYIIDVTSGSVTSLTPAMGKYVKLSNCWMPTISGDGSKIVFYSINANGSADIYVINSDGSTITPKKIFSNLMPVMPLEFPPLSLNQNGNKVVFSSVINGNPEIFIWQAGAGVTQLTGIDQLTQGTANSSPSISGNGKKNSVHIEQRQC